MNKRCYDVNHQAYKNYGGRGITICDDWKGLDKIDNFIDWALSNGYSDDLTIDRIDNDGPYAPWNCRWVDRKTQNNNTRKTVYLTIDGVTKRESEWLKIYNLNKNTYRDRIHRGWDKVEAMTNPVNTKYSSTTGNRQATRGLNENE